MGIFDFLREKPAADLDTRNVNDPNIPISDRAIIEFLGLSGDSVTGENVNIETALGVPAIWAAVNFLSSTIAGLPLHIYRRKKESRERVSGRLAGLLNDAANDETSAFDWLKYKFDQVLTGGRGLTFIERNAAGQAINLWPLDPRNATIRRVNGRKLYEYRDDGKTHKYTAAEILDIPFMLKADGLGHRSPIMTNSETVGLAIAVTKHGARYFANGGVPAFAIEGPFKSPFGMQRASEDLAAALKKAARERRQALALPPGHTIKELGANLKDSQNVELNRFLTEEIARIYSLPPNFLQDLTNGTFSNTEQQDLHLVKHTLKRWVEQAEKEFNLKIFGRHSRARYAEFNLDGMLRGDFVSRFEGYSQGVQNAILKPNEIRRLENLPDDPFGDQLMIQGATVPVKNASEGLSDEK